MLIIYILNLAPIMMWTFIEILSLRFLNLNSISTSLSKDLLGVYYI